jgi:hypothetical protein
MAKRAFHLMHGTERDDPTRQLLAGLFWRASTPLVAGLLLQACGQEAASPSEIQNALTDPTMNCVDGRWRPMSALDSEEPSDFAALRGHASFGHPVVIERDAAGTPCARASEPRLCEAEMRRVSVMETEQRSSHILLVQGDTVRALKTLADRVKWLGAIDTPDEALLLVDQLGLPIGCGQQVRDEGTQVALRDTGYQVITRTPDRCGNERTAYTVDVERDGTVNIVLQESIPTSGCAIGRRPPNLLARAFLRERANPLARYFARVARLEAASVDAFEQLAEELRVLGAPRVLRDAARRAAEDEVRHARDTATLAEHFGARAEKPKLARRRLRSRAEVALDNALEGCVHETYSAYIATAQARLARGPLLSVPLERIARDETAHAALAWQIASWIEPTLDPRVRARVGALRAGAIARLG